MALWALNFYLAGVLLDYSSVPESGFWRYAFGVLTLFLLTMRKLPSLTVLKPDFFRVFLIGFVGLFLFNYFFFQGMKTTSPMNATLITSLNPAITLVLASVVLGDVIKPTHWIGIAVAMLGSLYFVTHGSLNVFTDLALGMGDVWILLATTVFALHHVWVKAYRGPLSIQQFTLVTNAICFLGFVVIVPFYGLGQIASYPFEYWLAAIVMGALSTALAYYIWNRGIEELGAAASGIYINLIPVFTALMAAPFGDKVESYHIIGGLIIIAGVTIMQRGSRTQSNLK